ncbi:recombination-associated protein RdgC [Umboniibacter marinipuniceus]|uniref:Recombination-associated protein RdgC n=1 Tax=Umboniibacter marinipuniceus TaxID=569599 RepID=A0A3M0AT50_9GAMM|nr:recombination-associated protein RdgC [Umboniibacter marinipuniceus]RMA82182.1 recombination associated protein RdgC [Umboniibacter marinipuniceus]
MWFKNLRLYQLTQPFDLTGMLLEEKLQSNAFVECGSQDASKLGWISPFGRHGTALVHEAADGLWLTAKKQEKVLPASVINELLAERIADIEADQARKVYKKEKAQMKDELLVELLPRAFTKSSLISGYLDLKRGWFVVNSSSAARAEELINLVRDSIGSFALVPWSTQQLPSDTLTLWLESRAPQNFVVGEEAELVSRQVEGGVARLKEQDLLGDEVKLMLESGKRVKRLELLWRDQISVIVDEDLAIKRLKLTDAFQESLDTVDGDSIAAQLDHEFASMVVVYRGFLDDLLAAFGGPERSETA